MEFTDVTSGNLISTIGKHSAVSNIHLNIKNNLSITLSGGFIAETNNGLIFNCSVQGKGIEITGYVGVIAGANNGTISYSYSGIEILNVSSASGIAYTNNSVINSCYFTGYINSGAASAGIMLAVSQAQTENVYVYNNYMAGVITNINTNGTSFFAGNIANFDGKNNYIDQFANNELGISESYKEGPTGSETTIQVLTSVTTAELISRYSTYLFKGKWYTTPKNITTQVVNGVEELISVEINTDTIDVDKTINGTFGYNYGYPIYKFR